MIQKYHKQILHCSELFEFVKYFAETIWIKNQDFMHPRFEIELSTCDVRKYVAETNKNKLNKKIL